MKNVYSTEQKQLLQAIQTRNSRKFYNLLHRLEGEKIIRWIKQKRFKLGNAISPKDLLQDVSQSWIAKKKLESGYFDGVKFNGIRNKLRKATENLCINQYKKAEKNRTEVMTPAVENTQSEETRNKNPVFSDEFNALLNQITEKERETFILKVYEGYKEKEIATMLQTTEGAVKQRYRSARQKMRKYYETNPPSLYS